MNNAPYSVAYEANGTLYVSGQLPVDANGKLGESVAEQTRLCLENVRKAVEANGFTMDEVVKTTVFMKDFSHFAEMNEEYVKHFGEKKPARSACEVSALAKNAGVEINAIAVHQKESK